MSSIIATFSVITLIALFFAACIAGWLLIVFVVFMAVGIVIDWFKEKTRG